MDIISSLDTLSDTISAAIKRGETIGFVPTMGALHTGHLALIQKSMEQNMMTVVSIFVNPLQFNTVSDLEKYPRVIDDDIKLLERQNVDILFNPSAETLYPTKPIISINFDSLAKTLEGEFRKGHFEGVGVVVSKLLHLVRPTQAYFGQKDLQQFLLVKRMCSELNFPCEIVGVETIREPSGLALSSRNRRLSDAGRKNAAIIYQGLDAIKNGLEQGEPLKSLMEKTTNFYNQQENFDLEYVEAINPLDLSKIEDHDSLENLAVCVAGYIEGIRLIDNLYLPFK